MSRTTSGRVRTRFSLHPSSSGPPKSAAANPRCCSMVPMAPSSTKIRCESSSRKALPDSFRLRIPKMPCTFEKFPKLVVCPVYNLTAEAPPLRPRAIDLFDDLFDSGAPDERLGVLVPSLQKCLDGSV